MTLAEAERSDVTEQLGQFAASPKPGVGTGSPRSSARQGTGLGPSDGQLGDHERWAPDAGRAEHEVAGDAGDR